MTTRLTLRTTMAILLAILAITAHSEANAQRRIKLGQIAGGSDVNFVLASSGKWGLEISDRAGPALLQSTPAQVEVYRGEKEVHDLAEGYKSVRKEGSAIVANAALAEGNASLGIEDRWMISGGVLVLSRKVVVTGTEANAGFYSAINFSTTSAVSWPDVDFLAPGLLYGKPHTRATAPGGSAHDSAKRYSFREDYLSAPVFAMRLHDNRWLAMMDMSPRGDTTADETTAQATTPIIDENIRFGALGAHESNGGKLEFGFWLPGTTDEFSGGFGFGGRPSTPITPIIRRRYNPLSNGFTQQYQVGFRLGSSPSFLDVERDVWRWAWQTLKPQPMKMDVDVARTALIDHLADRVLVVNNRAGIPFVIDSVSGKPGSFRPALLLAQNPRFGNVPPPPDLNQIVDFARSLGIDIDPKAAELDLWPKIELGFCGKNIEAAGQFLMESDRDPSPRGQRLRKLGLMIIDSMVRLDPMNPAPAAEGFDIRTGEPSAARSGATFSLRPTAEDMSTMVDVIRREQSHGRQHPEWTAWVKHFADWLLTAQRPDGSFPEVFEGSTGKPRSDSGGTSYAAVPFLVRMSRQSGRSQYLDAATRAANFVWATYGKDGVYVGATGGDVADKESGMLSMQAFLDLYGATKDRTWLDRAKSAADYTESYIWLWNVPMPSGLADSELGWKHGVSTVGVTGIASNVPGEVDEYLDWAAPLYAQLYKETNDQHYLDVARILLFNTKSMLALPGRTYDLLGPGWQQEHWRMGPNVRGIGAHRTWLPWISVNHIASIVGLEDLDPALYKQVIKDK